MKKLAEIVAGAVVLFAGMIQAALAQASATTSAEEQVSGLIAGILVAAKQRLSGLAADISEAPTELMRLMNEASTAMPTGNGILTITYGLILVIVGAGAEWLYWTYASPVLTAVEAATVANPRQGFRLAMRRFGMRVFGLALFVVGIVGAAAYFNWPSGFDSFVIAAILLTVIVRFAWLVADTIASPGSPQLRLGAIEPNRAGRFVTAAVGMAFLIALSYFLFDLLERSAGAPHAASALRVCATTLTALIVLAAVLAGHRQGRSRARAGGRMPPRFPYAFLATVLVLGIYGVWLAAGSRAASLFAIAAIVAAIQTRLRNWVFFFWPEDRCPRKAPRAPA